MRRLLLLCLLAGCDSLFGLDTVTTEPQLDPGPWSQASPGDGYTCALQQDGSLWCWGANPYGQLGLGDVDLVDSPTRVGDAAWRSVVTGTATTCGIRTDDTLWCWGANASGQVGDGTTDDRKIPVQVAGTWASVSVWSDDACAIQKADGSLHCWGGNNHGQLGNGTNAASATPVAVTSTESFSSVGVAQDHTCALATDHRVWCWGSADDGQLGNGTLFVESNVPVLVSTQTYDALSVGAHHACALRGDGVLECWGLNASGQLGDPSSMAFTQSPTRMVDPTDEWASVTAGADHTCATKTDRSLWCWGSNATGQTGQGAQVLVGAGASQVTDAADEWGSAAAGRSSSCGVGVDGNLWCWGLDAASSKATVTTPTQVPGSWRQVSVGHATTCAIADDAALACWGRNEVGQLGDGTRLARTEPVRLGGSWKTVANTVAETCAIDGADKLYCWGYNIASLGEGSMLRLFPTQITDKSWTATALTNSGTIFGIEAGTGALYAWGTNSNGVAGSGDTSESVTPRLVVDSHTWTSIEGGFAHACGRDEAGLACWGDGQYGELGDGASATQGYFSSRPVQISTPSAAAASTPTAGGYFTCSLDDTGTAWCWGINASGQGGIGAAVAVTNQPQRVPGGPWKQLSAGFAYVVAVAADDTLWAWGSNHRGQFGDGTLTPQYMPVQVDANPVWSAVSAGTDHTCGLHTDHTLWCWGSNDDGQLGLGVLAADGTPRLILAP